jgi:DNA-binding NarL/FixJ family response regulator
MIKIILADDHHAVRKSLLLLLKNEPDFEVVAEAVNGLDAVDLVKNFCPNILVLDIMMPKMTGLEVIGILTNICPSTRIIVLSMHKDESYIAEAFCQGARAYVLKDNISDELIAAIRQVSKGNCYLGPSLNLQPEERIKILIK